MYNFLSVITFILFEIINLKKWKNSMQILPRTGNYSCWPRQNLSLTIFETLNGTRMLFSTNIWKWKIIKLYQDDHLLIKLSSNRTAVELIGVQSFAVSLFQIWSVLWD